LCFGKKRPLELKLDDLLQNLKEDKKTAEVFQRESSRLDALQSVNVDYAKMVSLISEYELLKEKESKFWSFFAEKSIALEKEIELFTLEDPSLNIEKEAEFEVRLQRETERLQKARAFVVTKNKDVLFMQRCLDNVPSKLDLKQYHRRFAELYHQLSLIFSENKQLCERFNSENDIQEAFDRKHRLFSSFLETVSRPSVISSRARRQELVTNLEEILFSVEQKKDQATARMSQAQDDLDAQIQRYKTLKSASKAFEQLVRQFRSACAYNSTLRCEIKRLGIADDAE